MLLHQREYKPAFGIAGHTDQLPMAVYHVLSINELVGDCAAYEGIGPADADDDLIEKIRAGGTKISESEAREIFPEIEEKGLRYRR
jgi:hypothetical protein